MVLLALAPAEGGPKHRQMMYPGVTSDRATARLGTVALRRGLLVVLLLVLVGVAVEGVVLPLLRLYALLSASMAREEEEEGAGALSSLSHGSSSVQHDSGVASSVATSVAIVGVGVAAAAVAAGIRALRRGKREEEEEQEGDADGIPTVRPRVTRGGVTVAVAAARSRV